jgi:hypothetical protein
MGDGPAAVVERETVFAVFREVYETGGLEPGVRVWNVVGDGVPKV